MARKNRMSIPDAFYHVTTRIAHREMLLAGEAVKDRIMEIIYSTAIFSGVEVYAWCIMDNHLHILVHVPKVPWELWTEEGHEPDAYAFGMRPPECREPMWPSPSTGTVPRPRPAVGFTLEDDEFVERLAGIYGRERAERRVDSWHRLEEAGCAERAMADRERLCRRMYNVSQYAKTLFERIAMQYNVRTGHRGVLWEGRFYSGLVDDEARAKVLVSAYIAYNPAKAGMVRDASAYRWSSWAEACGDGPRAAHYRGVYARVFGGTWEEARGRMESLFAERLPERFEGLSKEEALKLLEEELSRLERREGDGAPEETPPSLTIGQMIKVGCSPMRKGVFISFDGGFRRRVVKVVGWRFPMGDDRSVRRLMRLDSTLAWRTPRAA